MRFRRAEEACVELTSDGRRLRKAHSAVRCSWEKAWGVHEWCRPDKWVRGNEAFLFCLWWDATQKQGWASWVTGDERGLYLGNRQQEPANGLKGSPQHCYCSDFGSCCVFYNLTQSSWLFCHHIKSLFLSYATRCLGSFMRNLSPSFRNVPSNFVFFSPCFWVLSGITLLYAQDLCLPAFED